MNKYINSEINQHMMRLLMIGANVQVVNGKMVYVKFPLTSEIQVSYVYHMNKKNKYFLERIKPYPIPIKELDSAEAVIETIVSDYERYNNAVKSKNVKKFIEANQELNKSIKLFEDLFLNYNVPEELIEKLSSSIREIKADICKANNYCDEIHIEKETKE